MSNLSRSGPELVSGAPFCGAIRAEQEAFFREEQPNTGVAFLVPISDKTGRPFDLATEKFGLGQAMYGGQIGVNVEVSYHRQVGLDFTIRQLGNTGMVHGVILGEPVPYAHGRDQLRSAIPAHKDIDGVNPSSPFFRRRPTPSAMVHIAQQVWGNLSAAKTAVVGSRGAIGSALVCQLEDLGSRPVGIDVHNVGDLHSAVREADVVFTAARSARIITPEMLTGLSNLVIDAAIVPTEEGIVGNVDPRAYEDSRIHSSITPVPGGVGMLNRAMVFENLRSAIGTAQAA
ncbi:bifunctional 5,10-methylenetetrahydrofolate dehydrogenase/5,10-methenyltetrahydrofolate cyclohydrolase [Candidatus Saccharibacteria bacterium]|nr:MAG: bifunctional 5,10-methylenetetrahydrofolate dehydrogenase/5,10-methenyltetrahydrofolate cyclohydrolase [Candidatus Saccharibacteria bacterium]